MCIAFYSWRSSLKIKIYNIEKNKVLKIKRTTGKKLLNNKLFLLFCTTLYSLIDCDSASIRSYKVKNWSMYSNLSVFSHFP